MGKSAVKNKLKTKLLTSAQVRPAGNQALAIGETSERSRSRAINRRRG